MPSPAVKGRGCLALLPRILAARIARGWRVAPGPMTRRCSHLMMIAPRRPPGGNRGMPPAARRPVWVSVQPSAGPIARCSFAYAIFPPFSFPHVPPCQPPACSRKAAAQWHARRNRQLETDCRQTGHSHVNVLQGSEPGCGAPYNRDAFVNTSIQQSASRRQLYGASIKWFTVGRFAASANGQLSKINCHQFVSCFGDEGHCLKRERGGLRHR